MGPARAGGEAAPRFGAFGKLPALGDFLRSGLPAAFVGPWDRWLQSVLLAARAATGGGWEAHYLRAPIWRFALAPGLAGPEGAMGVLMPSVDAVGRRFPLTLAATVPASWPTLPLHFGAGATHEALEAAALAVLGEGQGAGVAALKGALERIPPPVRPAGAPLREGPGTLLASGGVAALAAALATPRFGRPSVWDEAGGALAIVEGLPEGVEAAALFAADAPRTHV